MNNKFDAEFITSLSNFKKVILIASSTGGTQALEKLLADLPEDTPPVVIVQHMPAGFTNFFAERLNTMCKPEVREAKDGDYIRSGLVLIAPGDFHLSIAKSGTSFRVHIFKGEKIHGVMPAADVMFESAAKLLKDKAVGVILTGMGTDGAIGLLEMKKSGSKNIGQNKETCVVYGMPKAAFDIGALDKVLPLSEICKKMLSYALD